ncbi:hypothetical protein PF008_g25881 [Phytophthora fragariae]|uniref:Uncharacterized protein n=1 Tax=Phytophthora fragariae TaxID=53985 RepID=A0A6G0QJF4_9STRA|nr:hypothetical protein PF008_g25881 [Phytophthora fragariae]
MSALNILNFSKTSAFFFMKYLRVPNELLRSAAVSEAGDLTAYHQRLIAAMKASHECAERARAKE